VKRAARAYGLADPALLLARLRCFAQPSEVAEPIELLRAGVLFHARGIINTKAIQHNLDWVWPYWVERQFNPEDVSFIPRAFSISHVNLTHRNWTAVGLPELALYPIVDPRGLVTPITDGWSLDCWVLGDSGKDLLPSRLPEDAARQELLMDAGLAIATTCRHENSVLKQTVSVVIEDQEPLLQIEVSAQGPACGWLVVGLRPYNPEGIQFIDRVATRANNTGWTVNDKWQVLFDRPAERLLASDYSQGDVLSLLRGPAASTEKPPDSGAIHCRVGMATAAAVFNLEAGKGRVQVRVPLAPELRALGNSTRFDPAVTWKSVRSRTATLRIPDSRLQFLYDAAVSTLVLLSADEIVPGPYTYRRFWFRDACLMMNALLALGMEAHCRRAIERFPSRQLRSGYFRSQEGEWDSNGQVLWILDRYQTCTDKPLPEAVLKSLPTAVSWIERKRVRAKDGVLHAGLLPAGFSAEHLGPNDHYYWDDYWGAAGLAAAAKIFSRLGRQEEARAAAAQAADFRRAIERSISRIPARSALGGIPASPYRRLDAGAIGSLVADYPLQFYPPAEPRIMTTVERLLKHCFLQGGFFQDMIHSGINAYLTLDIAQTLLRAGDMRYRDLVEAVAALASPTGQWPEAIHPHTGGGCMGDGQHGWAAAEWALMLRNCFVREEADRLIVGSGLFAEWFDQDDELLFGPTLTAWGPVTVRVTQPATAPLLTIDAQWHGEAPAVDVLVPGFQELRGVEWSDSISLVKDPDAEQATRRNLSPIAERLRP
jgi:hypothetical protein